MSNTAKLIETAVLKKPADFKETFKELMVEKMRDVITEHSDHVAETLFDESDDDDYLEEGGRLEWAKRQIRRGTFTAKSRRKRLEKVGNALGDSAARKAGSRAGHAKMWQDGNKHIKKTLRRIKDGKHPGDMNHTDPLDPDHRDNEKNPKNYYKRAMASNNAKARDEMKSAGKYGKAAFSIRSKTYRAQSRT